MKKFAGMTMLLAAALAAGAMNAAAVSLNVPFNAKVLYYTATVSNDVTQITINARTSDPSATVTVNGADPDTPVALAVGENTITIVVTAADGRTRLTYTVTVTREASGTVPGTDGITSPQAGYAVPDDLIQTVRRYYQMNLNNPGGGENWFRVLIAFGAETHATLKPFTVAEAEVSVTRWSGWQPVLDALRKIAAANTTAAPAVIPTVSLSAAPNPVAEGSAVRVTATLSAALAGSVTVPLAVTRGTSEAGDHGTLSGILIPAGAVSATGAITTADDADADDETFTVALGALPSRVTAGSVSSVAVTISDDDTVQTQAVIPQQQPGGDSEGSTLVTRLRGYRNDPQLVHHKPHTDRWDRALLALGETVADGTLTPMSAAEAQGYADQGWTRWVEVAAALKAREGSDPQPDPASNQDPEPTGDDADAASNVLEGTANADRLNGDDEDNEMYGYGGNDLLVGHGGHDLLYGGDGNDTLTAGPGNDELHGGSGFDTLVGGPGADRFVVSSSDTGSKVLRDFGDGDVIVLRTEEGAAAWPALADIIAEAEAVGTAGYLYDLGDGLTVETTNRRLTAGNFRVE